MSDQAATITAETLGVIVLLQSPDGTIGSKVLHRQVTAEEERAVAHELQRLADSFGGSGRSP